MADILRRVGVDVPEQLRRLLDGSFDSWLRVEEFEDSGSMVVRTEVPGINPEKDVEITLAGNQLSIDVRHEEKSEHKDKKGYRSEFRYGTFSRTVTLPAGVKEEDIHASYNDGVLEIRVPVQTTSATESRKIPVTRGSASSAEPETSGGPTGGAYQV